MSHTPQEQGMLCSDDIRCVMRCDSVCTDRYLQQQFALRRCWPPDYLHDMARPQRCVLVDGRHAAAQGCHKGTRKQRCCGLLRLEESQPLCLRIHPSATERPGSSRIDLVDPNQQRVWQSASFVLAKHNTHQHARGLREGFGATHERSTYRSSGDLARLVSNTSRGSSRK